MDFKLTLMFVLILYITQGNFTHFAVGFVEQLICNSILYLEKGNALFFN